MRADICAALLHNPQLLFLDEPTIGLDVVAKERIREFIHYINAQRGTTILLTTHDMADVERLCSRVMIIDKGQLLYDGRLQTLHEQFGGRRELEPAFGAEGRSGLLVGCLFWMVLCDIQGRLAMCAFPASPISEFGYQWQENHGKGYPPDGVSKREPVARWTVDCNRERGSEAEKDDQPQPKQYAAYPKWNLVAQRHSSFLTVLLWANERTGG